MRFKKFVKESSSFTDWLLASFTLVLAAVAILQFVIIWGQLDVMRKDERAWITVTKKPDITVTVDPIPSATLVVADTGKTPARHIRGHAVVEIVPNGSSPHFEQGAHALLEIGTISPNSSIDFPVTRQRYKVVGQPELGAEDYNTTDAEKAALADGTDWIAVHGIVQYDDVFNAHHWIRFCSWTKEVPGIYSARTCATYNDQDTE